MFEIVALFFAGIFAGLVDSIAGGGGLISLPIITLFLGPGPNAIGTNKIVGVVASLTAITIYAKNKFMNWIAGGEFLVYVAIGAYIGANSIKYVPNFVFKWLIVALCPIILFLLYNKEKFLNPKEKKESSKILFIISGLACGFYDGFFGPGAGTFMLLALLYFVKLPLMQSLAISKFANSASAIVALTTFIFHGYVNYELGISIALGVFLGASVGANLASKKAASIVFPILAFVTILLALTLIFTK